MYSKEEENRLQKLSDRILKEGFPAGEIPASQVDSLTDVLNYHDWRYYVKSDPVISDYDYDELYRHLKELEGKYPDLVQPDSPTQRVAKGLNEDFPTVSHLAPMLSLENSYNAEDLWEFDRRVRESLISSTKFHYAVEPKYDGSSIALVYEDDIFVRAATRGNGVEGDDITNNARVIRSIPLKAPFSKYGIRKIEIRGEVILDLETFNELNQKRLMENQKLREQGKKEIELFKHARNTAAGALRLKDPQLVAERKLEAAIYQVGYAEDMNGGVLHPKKTHMESLDWLGTMGFKVPSYEKGVFRSMDEVIEFCHQWEEKRDSYPYEIDGMVVKVNELRLQELIGRTSHHPKWAIAFKFKAKQAITKLLRVDFQVGRTGVLTPVAKLDPVILTGVEISSVSLHNEDFIVEKDIRLGDMVIVERAGDVIPYIVGSVEDRRTGEEKTLRFPDKCPSCEASTVKLEGESAWRCVNPDCPAQLEEHLIHFVSKEAMNIEGLGKDIVKRFLSEGIIKGVADIYQLDYERIRSLEGWKDRSVEKLRQHVEKSRTNPIWRLLVGLGIQHVGVITAKMLASQVNNILEFREWSEERLLELEDVGPIVAASIRAFFSSPENIALIRKLGELGVNLEREDEGILENKLSGATFLFTGTLSRFSRDRAKELVEQYGGKNVSSVSANLNYLVAGEKAGSKLTKAEKLGSVNIISEDEFLEMIGQA